MFKEWNKVFTKLRYRHETWYIFRDFLDLTIDNYTNEEIMEVNDAFIV